MLLTNLFIYPVKALRGSSLTETAVEPRGLTGDRRFMVVDDAGRFLTQRHVPAMARIDVDTLPSGIRLRHAEHGELMVATPNSPARRSDTVVWNDTVSTLDAGDEAASWLTNVLDRPCRLVHQDRDARRCVDPRFAVEPGDEVSLADGYPVLVTSLSSLDDLNRRLESPVPMDRFRPNLVLSSDAPYVEDHWKRLRIGEVEFALVKPCARCAVTTVDQETGARTAEPLRTLKSYRSVEGRVLFGMNAIPIVCGRIRVGDQVEVLG